MASPMLHGALGTSVSVEILDPLQQIVGSSAQIFAPVR